MSIHINAGTVRARMLQAHVGQATNASILNEAATMVNEDPQAAQVSTITVDTVTNSATYTVEINDATISYTADSSTANTEIVAGLVAAIQANPTARGICSPVATSSTVVTVTGVYPGVAFDISDDDAKLTTATTTSAASATAIPFGRVMIGAGFGTGDAVEQGILCATSSLVAQVDTLTATYAASEVYIISITIEGQQYGPVQVTANTDSATTATDIVTAINAMMPANTVLAAATSGGALTLTAEVAGKAFSVSYGVKSGTAARLTLTHTTAGERSDINRCFRGISAHVHNNESTAIGASTPSYPPNSAVKVWTRGEVWVSNSQTPDGDDPVYVETASGSDSGKLYNTTSATRILLDRSVARWRRSGATAADNLAVVQIGA